MPPAPASADPRFNARRTDGYWPTLDGWRALAIVLVLVDHGVNSTVCAAGSLRWCERITVGQTGVNLFFGISGFLISTRLLEQRARTGHISLRDFYIRRAFRILPPALVYLSVLTILALSRQILLSRAELEGSLFFYRNYLTPEVWFYTGHFWSLSIEEQFYLAWPALLLVLLALPRLWPAALAAGIAGLVALWRHASVALALMTSGHLSRGFFLHTGVRADGLLLGAAWAIALARGAHPLDRVSIWLWGGLAATYVAIVVHFGPHPTIWESALVPLLITWTATHPTSLPGRVLESSVPRWLGRISYSLYIWQQFFFPPGDVAAPMPLVQRWPIAVPAALMCAVLSYYLLERPAIRLGHRLAAAADRRQDAVYHDGRPLEAAAV